MFKGVIAAAAMLACTPALGWVPTPHQHRSLVRPRSTTWRTAEPSDGNSAGEWAGESREERQRRRDRSRGGELDDVPTTEDDDGPKYNPLGLLDLADDAEVLSVSDLAAKEDCACGSRESYGECCLPLFESAELAQTAMPVQLLKARYTAYTKELVDFIMDSTHPTADDWRDDRALWSEELKDFCRCVRFEKMDVLQHRVVNDDVEMVTFAARMVVLEDLLRPELVQTKEFTERAKFIKEDGRWFYAGGDEDFEPTNVVVAGPPDKPAAGGGGMKGKVKAKAKSKSKAKAKAR